jgi:hypothetical protein
VRDLLIRIVLGSPCLGIAVWMMLQPGDANMNMLMVFPCLLAFALIVVPSSTTVAASAWGALFLPQKDAAPRPATRRAEELRFEQKFDAALVEYENLTRQFPRDLDLWNACFEIAWVRLADPALAEELLEKALPEMTDPPIERRLRHLYRIQKRRFEDTA